MVKQKNREGTFSFLLLFLWSLYSFPFSNIFWAICMARSWDVFLCWCCSIRSRMLVRAVTASTMYGPLLSMTHSAVRPWRVGNFSSRRKAFFDQIFKDLSRPNDRHVGRFTNPHDFFLKFCQAPIADFNGQVPAGNHDAQGLFGRSLDDDFRQVVYGFLVFDFSYQGNLAVSLPQRF